MQGGKQPPAYRGQHGAEAALHLQERMEDAGRLHVPGQLVPQERRKPQLHLREGRTGGSRTGRRGASLLRAEGGKEMSETAVKGWGDEAAGTEGGPQHNRTIA